MKLAMTPLKIWYIPHSMNMHIINSDFQIWGKMPLKSLVFTPLFLGWKFSYTSCWIFGCTKHDCRYVSEASFVFQWPYWTLCAAYAKACLSHPNDILTGANTLSLADQSFGACGELTSLDRGYPTGITKFLSRDVHISVIFHWQHIPQGGILLLLCLSLFKSLISWRKHLSQ